MKLVTMAIATLLLALIKTQAAEQPINDSKTQGLLLVANKTDQTLSIIDPSKGSEIAVVPVQGNTGHEVAASPDGKKAFVPIFGDSGVGRPGSDGDVIRVVDLEQKKIVATIELGKGLRPHCATFGPRNGLLYVTAEIENAVLVIDPQLLKVTARIPTGRPESHMLAITSDGTKGYASNVGSGTVSVLDLVNHTTLEIIPVANKAQRICLSPDDRWAFTADQEKAQMAVIDTRTNGVSRWIPLPGIGYGAAVTPDNKWLVVALVGRNQVALVDLQSMSVTKTLEAPAAPQEVLIRPDGGAAYVSCDRSAKIAVIDLKDQKVERLLSAGRGADGLAWVSAPGKPARRVAASK